MSAMSSKLAVACALALEGVHALLLRTQPYHITVPKMASEQCHGCQQIESLKIDADSRMASAVIEKALQKIEGKSNFPSEWSNGSNFYLLDTNCPTSEIYEGEADLPPKMNYALHQKVPVTLIGPDGVETTILTDKRRPFVTSEQLAANLGPLGNFRLTTADGDLVLPNERDQVPIAEASTITATRTAEAEEAEETERRLAEAEKAERRRADAEENLRKLLAEEERFAEDVAGMQARFAEMDRLQAQFEEKIQEMEEARRLEARREERARTGLHVRNQMRRFGNQLRRIRENGLADSFVDALMSENDFVDAL